MEIIKIKAREILDSRGNPTVESEVFTKKGRFRASVPSGASTGKHEALELRDGEKRYYGKGVKKAVKNINRKIAKELEGIEVEDQEKIDKIMLDLDGTEKKENLGANAILSISMAVARAGAASKDISLWQHISELADTEPRLPFPCFNILNGGEHAGNNLEIQEFMISPRFNKFSLNLKAGSEIYHSLKSILNEEFSPNATNIGDEGGFAPLLDNNETALSLLEKAVKKAGCHKDEIKFALDCAASEFFNEEKNGYEIEGKVKDVEEMINFYGKLIDRYPLFSIEDPLNEDDFKGWGEFMKKYKDILLVGDDLLTTNPERIKKAIENKSCNALLLKINQIGSITESIQAMKLARSEGWEIMVSHRSGETCDNFIADLAVGIGAKYIKSGAPARGERISKYNQLLRIEEKLDKNKK